MKEKKDSSVSGGEELFTHLVMMFQVAAMQHMGKITNPLTKKVERDMDQAKFAIDMLDMIKEKTRGNLGKAESDLLEKVLFELHMNYVDEVERLKKEPPGGEEGGSGSAAREGGKEAGEGNGQIAEEKGQKSGGGDDEKRG